MVLILILSWSWSLIDDLLERKMGQRGVGRVSMIRMHQLIDRRVVSTRVSDDFTGPLHVADSRRMALIYLLVLLLPSCCVVSYRCVGCMHSKQQSCPVWLDALVGTFLGVTVTRRHNSGCGVFWATL